MLFLSSVSSNFHLGKGSPKKRNGVITEQSLSGQFSKGLHSDATTAAVLMVGKSVRTFSWFLLLVNPLTS